MEANPADEIVATAVLEDDQVAVVVRSFVELSLKVPVAANCWVLPIWIEGLAGVTDIDTSDGGGAIVTISVVEPVTPAEAA